MRHFKLTFSFGGYTLISGQNIQEALKEYFCFKSDLTVTLDQAIKVEELTR
jgi:hypothetical protein